MLEAPKSVDEISDATLLAMTNAAIGHGEHQAADEYQRILEERAKGNRHDRSKRPK